MTVDTLPTYVVATQSDGKPVRHDLLARAIREPLVHFLILGGALFLLNTLLTPAIPADRKITLTTEDRQSIVESFTGERRREPTPQEMDYLTHTWLLNEITYREALAQGLDKGDEMIRERLMQKMRVLIFSNIASQTPNEADLQHWLEANADRFDTPERITLLDLPIGPSADEANAAAKNLSTERTEESLRLRVRNLGARPRPSLEIVYGAAFVEKLAAVQTGTWHALEAPDGWHVVRVDEIEARRRVTLNEVRDQAENEWKEAAMRARAVQTVRDLGKKYVIQGIDAP